MPSPAVEISLSCTGGLSCVWGQNKVECGWNKQLWRHRSTIEASQVALVVKNPLPKQETKQTQVRSLGQEDPLDEGMATHSSIRAWRILRTEEPGGYSPWGRKELDTT